MLLPKEEKNRYEIKFVLNEEELTEALFFLKKNGFFQKYSDRIVNSLYFDSPDFQSAQDNLSGVSNRNKLRLRWYSRFSTIDDFVMEIKSRSGRLGSKKKYLIKYFDKKVPLLKLNVFDIKSYVFKYLHEKYKYNCILNECSIPILYVRYNRKYYENKSAIRITIDSGICFRNINLNSPIGYHQELPYNEYIMELKFPVMMKNDVSNLIRTLNLTPKRHSKYLVGLSKLGYTLYI